MLESPAGVIGSRDLASDPSAHLFGRVQVIWGGQKRNHFGPFYTILGQPLFKKTGDFEILAKSLLGSQSIFLLLNFTFSVENAEFFIFYVFEERRRKQKKSWPKFLAFSGSVAEGKQTYFILGLRGPWFNYQQIQIFLLLCVLVCHCMMMMDCQTSIDLYMFFK